MSVILTRPIGTGGLIVGLSISTINGQPTLTLEDTTRGNKKLSVAEQVLIFSEATLANQEWLDIGNAVDADSGYIANFDGTIVHASGHCENTGVNSKNINIFINAADNGSIGTLTGGVDAVFNNTTLDLNFNQGDKIRLRAGNGTGGTIQDVVVRITMKWRG